MSYVIYMYTDLTGTAPPKYSTGDSSAQLSRVVVTSLGPEVGPEKSIGPVHPSVSGDLIYLGHGVFPRFPSKLQPEFCRAGQCTGQLVYLGLRVVCLEVWKLSLSRWGFGNPGRWVVYHIYIAIATDSSAITQLKLSHFC